MQIFSYRGCQSCLVKACCQNVCDEYRWHLYKTREILITKDPIISLEDAESLVASGNSKNHFTYEVDGKEHVVSLDMKIAVIAK